MTRCGVLISLCALIIALLAGCPMAAGPMPGSNDTAVSSVADKAVNIANEIGGPQGFGGMQMSGYMQNTSTHMGFNSTGDLASPGSMMTVTLHNESNQACTFHLSYFSSQAGTTDQTQDVSVPADGQTAVQIPCSEIVGLGTLEAPGSIGCTLASGQTVSNMMAVPGFMGMDYACGANYSMFLAPDVNDINGNGDTQELITMTDAMQAHITSNGMMSQMHSGTSMMQAQQ